MMAFIDLRKLHREREEQALAQREAITRDAAANINLLTTIVQAPGYKVWKDALLASAEAEHRNALAAKDAHSMAIALGAESAYRAAAHAAEDLIAANQNTIQAMKQR